MKSHSILDEVLNKRVREKFRIEIVTWNTMDAKFKEIDLQLEVGCNILPKFIDFQGKPPPELLIVGLQDVVKFSGYNPKLYFTMHKPETV